MAPSIGPTALFAPTAALRRHADETFRIVVSDELRSFAGIWPRSDATSPADCYGFQCADILDVWCETIGAARKLQPFFVAVLNNRGRPLMLLPLGIERRHGLRILTFLDAEVCDYNAPVVFPEADDLDAQAVRQIWKSLTTSLPDFDVALFDKMPDEIRGRPNPLLLLGARAHSPSGHITKLDGTWDEFAAKRLPRRRHTQRKRRRLAELGNLRFTIATTAADRTRLFDAMIRQKSRRLSEINAPAFEGPGIHAYYSELTRRMATGAPTHLAALEVDDTIIATHWGLHVHNRFYFLVPTYEGGDWSRFSPGRILLEHLIEWSFANGVEIFDFGVGDEAYKLEYRDRSVPLYRTVIPVTVAGHAFSAAASARRQLRSHLKGTRVWSMLKSLKSLSGGRSGPVED